MRHMKCIVCYAYARYILHLTQYILHNTWMHHVVCIAYNTSYLMRDVSCIIDHIGCIVYRTQCILHSRCYTMQMIFCMTHRINCMTHDVKYQIHAARCRNDVQQSGKGRKYPSFPLQFLHQAVSPPRMRFYGILFFQE